MPLSKMFAVRFYVWNSMIFHLNVLTPIGLGIDLANNFGLYLPVLLV